MRIEETLEAKLARWVREARQLATCSDCYGVGQDMRADDCRACSVCNGAGKAAREPHVIELVTLLRLETSSLARAVEARLDAEVEAAELRAEIDRLRADLYRLRTERMRERSE